MRKSRDNTEGQHKSEIQIRTGATIVEQVPEVLRDPQGEKERRKAAVYTCMIAIQHNILFGTCMFAI